MGNDKRKRLGYPVPEITALPAARMRELARTAASAGIPVWLNGKCYIGTIFSHHGAYRHGVDAEITLSSPREDEEVIGDYLISGLRHVIAITSGWKTREGDNGMQ